MKRNSILSGPPLAVLNSVVPAKERIRKPFTLEEDWDETRGWFQWVVNKDTGKKWNVGIQYDFEGFVDVLNTHILQGRFN